MRSETCYPIRKWIRINKWLLAVIMICGGYSLMLSLRTLPATEGWYMYYSDCMNRGEIIYKDFDYLLPPIYIKLVQFIQIVFGHSILAFRFLGVIIFCLISTIIYIICKELSNEYISFIAAVTSCFFLQVEVANIFYDYVRFMDVFSLLTVLFLIKYINSNDSHNLIVAGACNSIFFLVKQNMGGIFCLSTCCFILFYLFALQSDLKKSWLTMLQYLVSFFSPIIIVSIWMAHSNSLIPFFKQITSDAIYAKSGGEISVILFGWLLRSVNEFQNAAICVALFIVFIIIIKYAFNIKHNTEDFDYIRKVDSILFCTLISISLLIFYKYKFVAMYFDFEPYGLLYYLFVLNSFMFMFLLIKIITKILQGELIGRNELVNLCLLWCFLSIQWGTGMSGGLAIGQSTLGMCFLIIMAFNIIKFNNIKCSYVLNIIVVMICINLTLCSAAKKMIYPFAWWGICEESWWDQTTYSKEIDMLKGIRLSKQSIHAYETIYHAILKNTSSDDTIYCFPHIPLFYSMCSRKDPDVHSKVAWFDVVSDSSIEHDIEAIKASMPKAILISDLPEYVYEGHEKLFRKGKISSTRKMRNFLLDYVKEENYRFYGKISSSPSNHFLLWLKNES